MIRMKKSDLVIAYSILALVIGSLLAGFASCQGALSSPENESLFTPAKIPIGKVMNNGVTVLKATDYTGGDCQFVLNWNYPDAILTADGNYGPLDTEGNIDALKLVYLRWAEYKIYMRSDPYYPPIDEPDLGVWTNTEDGVKLMNKKNDQELRILRYWPRDLLAKNQPLTVSSWYTPESNARRKADFLAAKKQLEAQMAALKASPFWDVWYWYEGSHKYPLQEMWQEMGDFISTGDLDELYTNAEWDGYWEGEIWDRKPVTHNVGDLYTLYFGPIPRQTDYEEQGPDAHYVFPVD